MFLCKQGGNMSVITALISGPQATVELSLETKKKHFHHLFSALNPFEAEVHQHEPPPCSIRDSSSSEHEGQTSRVRHVQCLRKQSAAVTAHGDLTGHTNGTLGGRACRHRKGRGPVPGADGAPSPKLTAEVAVTELAC